MKTILWLVAAALFLAALFGTLFKPVIPAASTLPRDSVNWKPQGDAQAPKWALALLVTSVIIAGIAAKLSFGG